MHTSAHFTLNHKALKLKIRHSMTFVITLILSYQQTINVNLDHKNRD